MSGKRSSLRKQATKAREEVGSGLSSGWRGFLRAVFIVSVLVLAAAPAAFLFWIAWELEPKDISVWAMAIAAAALVGVTVLLFAIGEEHRTAIRPLDYPPKRPKRTIKVGERVPADAKGLEEGSDFERQRGVMFKALYLGKDGRWSTSKLQALLWTYALLFGLASLIVAMWLGDDAGWNEQQKLGLQEEYLLLLGGPFAAAVATKAITSQKVDDGTLDKTDAEETAGLGSGLNQVISDDEGNTDLVDTQYFLFNLLALGFFLGTFAFNLDQGFPDIPDLLVGLTSVSAAAYVAKKATDRGEPKLTSVAPAKAPVGTKVDVWGRNLLFGKDTASPPSVTVGGKVSPAVEVVSAGRANADRLRITIPELEPGDATIVVTPDGGKPTEPLDFEVERTIQVQKVSPERLKAGSHAPITIFGSGLKGEGGTSAELGGVPLTPADEEKWTDRRLTFTLDPNAAYPTNESADLIVSRNGEISETKQFFLEP